MAFKHDPTDSAMATARLLEALMRQDEQAGLAALREGADVASLERAGHPALAMAVDVGGFELFAALLPRGSLEMPGRGGSSPLGLAAFLKEDAMVRALLEAGASVHARGAREQTPLMHAAMAHPSPSTVAILLHASDPKDVEAVDTFGMTALGYAAICGDLESCALLLPFMGKGSIERAAKEARARSQPQAGAFLDSALASREIQAASAPAGSKPRRGL